MDLLQEPTTVAQLPYATRVRTTVVQGYLGRCTGLSLIPQVPSVEHIIVIPCMVAAMHPRHDDVI